MTTKLVFCYWGAGISLGIYGTKNEVTRTAGALYNFNATDSEPIWINDNEESAFAYVLTDWERLKKGYTDLFIAGTLQKEEERKKLGRSLKKICKEKAEARIASILSEPFLDNLGRPVEPYQLGFHSRIEKYTE